MADETPKSGIRDTPNGIYNLTGLTQEQMEAILGMRSGEVLVLEQPRPNRIVILVEGGCVQMVAADDDSGIEIVVVDKDADDCAEGLSAHVAAPYAMDEMEDEVREAAAQAVADCLTDGSEGDSDD